MKPHNIPPRNTAAGRRRSSPVHIPRIPLEWMDPMSWRLPSGKALAEFALQAGFLAPLMLERPNLKRKKAPVPAPPVPVVKHRVTEVPDHSGSFRRIQ